MSAFLSDAPCGSSKRLLIKRNRRVSFCFVFLFLLFLLLVFLTLVCGPVDLSLSELVKAVVEPAGEDVACRIIWDLRIPKMCAAVLAGGSLAVSGLCLQTVFRNPLCGPFVLGISSGSSLGVALAMLVGFSFGGFGVLGASGLGACAVTALILAVSARFRHNTVLLVAGLLMGYFIDALVSLLIAGAESENLKVYVAWGMGSFSRLTFSEIWIFALSVFVGLALVVLSIRYLNASRMGDEFSRGLGIRVDVYRRLVLLGVSLLAGASTAFCGPVAFVGIAVPHLSYMLARTTNHRVLIPVSALCGAVLSLAAGLFPVEIPLNAVLSIVGVPVILSVIVRGARRGASL